MHLLPSLRVSSQVPNKYQCILDETESIPWRRRNYEQHAFFQELLQRAEESSSFKYTSHLRRHERGITLIRRRSGRKSFTGSQFFTRIGGLGGDKYSSRWIFRVKVTCIVYVFFSCYQTFQVARDGLMDATFLDSMQ